MKTKIQEERYNKYDRILEACTNNIIATARRRHNNTIYIDKFNINKVEDLLYLEMCGIAQTLYGYPIYIQTNLFNYIKLKIKNRKKGIKFKKILKCPDSNREIMMDTVKNYHNKNDIIYRSIYNTYYNIKKGDN